MTHKMCSHHVLQSQIVKYYN